MVLHPWCDHGGREEACTCLGVDGDPQPVDRRDPIVGVGGISQSSGSEVSEVCQKSSCACMGGAAVAWVGKGPGQWN